MIRSRPWLGLVPAVIVLLLLSGCAQVLDLLGDTKTKPKGPSTSPSTLQVILIGLKDDLVAQGYSPAQAKAVSDSGLASVRLANLDEADLSVSIPAALEGVSKGIGQQSTLTQDQRVAGVDASVTSFVEGLSGNFEATSRSIRSIRALTANADVVSALLARISQVAVSSLKDTGIEPDRRGETAGGVVSNMIGSLGNGGVNKALVSEALVRITQSAVESLKDAGLSNTDALATAVASVTKGAVIAVSAITVEGVSSADYATLTSSVTSGAAEALGKISTSVEEVANLVKSVAQGSSQGIVEVAKVTSDQTVVSSMIQSATAGATSGVMKVDTVNASADAATMIGAITASASKALASSTIDATVAQTAVTVGAAAAAQTAVSSGMTEEALNSAIKLVDAAGATVTVDTTKVTEGITLGKNTPPAVSAGSDKTVPVQTLVTLEAIASDDKDLADQLVYQWALISKPAGSTVTVAGTAAKTTFTPDVVGTYLVSVRVTDSLKATTEALVSVFAIKNAATTTYEGLTAEARLDKAKKLVASGDLPEAQAEFLTILGRYPETSVTAETYFRLGQVYKDQGYNAQAVARWKEGITVTTPDTEVGARGRLLYGWFLINDKGDNSDETKALFQSVADAQQGTPWLAEALHGLANIRWHNGDYEGGIADLESILKLTPINPDRKFWVACDIGWALTNQKKWTEAHTAFKGLDVYVTNGVDASVSTLARYYWMFQWWFLGDAQNDPASTLSQLKEGRAALKDGLKDQRLNAADHAFLARILGESYLWREDQSRETYNLALPIFQEGLTYKSTDTSTWAKSERLWLQLRIGNANDQLQNVAVDDAERTTFANGAVAAYQLTQTQGWGKWYGWRPAGEAMVNAAGIYHWQLKDDTKAFALVNQVTSSYPAAAPQWPKAYAYYRTGEIYRDRAYKKRDQTGTDYAADFDRAIAAFSKVEPTSFPGVDPNEWFFVEKSRQIGDCYLGLMDYDSAVQYFQADLENPQLNPRAKAWSQFNLARCYAEQTLQLIRSGDAELAEATWLEKAGPAYDAVANFKEGDEWVEQGKVWAESLMNKGQMLQQIGNNLRYEAGLDPTYWTPAYELAVETFLQVNPTTFTGLPADFGRFVDAQQEAADCQLKLGLPAEARTTLQTLLDNMDARKISQDRYWSIRRDLAVSYRREAENLHESSDMPQSQALALATKRVALNQDSVAAIDALVTAWKAKPGNLDQAKDVAWALVEEGWAILDSAWTLGWRNGYSTTDQATIKGWSDKVEAVAGTLKTDFPAVGEGKALASISRIRGEWYSQLAYWFSLAYSSTDALSYRATAWDSYEAAVQSVVADGDTLGASLRGQVDLLLEKAWYETDVGVRKAAFEQAFDLTAKLIVNPEVSIWAPANAALSLSRAYLELHGAYSTDPSQLGGLGVIGMDGFNGWRTSVKLLLEPIVKKEGNYAELQDDWLIQEAKRLLDAGSIFVQVE